MDTLQSRQIEVIDMAIGFNLVFPDTNRIRLFTAPIVNGTELQFSDFTEATFPGYGAVPVSVASPVIGFDVLANVRAKNNGAVSFASTGGAGGQTIYGWYITDNPATQLFAYGFFDTPIPMVNSGDTLLVTPYVRSQFIGNDDHEFLAGP